jgi:dissimilatory sulfite reductase related protein
LARSTITSRVVLGDGDLSGSYVTCWPGERPTADDLAPEEAGIETLTPQHWQVVSFMRHEYAEKGTGPSVRALSKTSGVSIKELYQLFPKGPAKLAAKIAGIPKPRGCI